MNSTVVLDTYLGTSYLVGILFDKSKIEMIAACGLGRYDSTLSEKVSRMYQFNWS